MKICFITQNYPPNPNCSGAEIDTYNIAHEFAAKGHQIQVIITGENNCEFKDGNIDIHRVAKAHQRIFDFFTKHLKISYFGSLENLMTSINISKKLKELTNNGKIDIIHMPDFGALGYYYLHNKKRKPVILKLHIPIFFQQKYNNQKLSFFFEFLKKINNRVTAHIEQYCIKKADKVISPSQFLANEIQKVCGKINIQVLPNAAKFENYKHQIKKHIPHPVVLCVSYISQYKGTDLLMEIALKTLKVMPDIIFRIIGKDTQIGAKKNSYLQYLEKKYKLKEHEKNIIFEGHHDQNYVKIALKEADILIHTSRMENHPLALLEAMGNGLPIICFAVGGNPEIVDDGENGILIEPYNIEKFSQALLALLKDKETLTKLSKACLQKAEQFSIKTHVKKLRAIYKDVLSIHGKKQSKN